MPIFIFVYSLTRSWVTDASYCAGIAPTPVLLPKRPGLLLLLLSASSNGSQARIMTAQQLMGF